MHFLREIDKFRLKIFIKVRRWRPLAEKGQLSSTEECDASVNDPTCHSNVKYHQAAKIIKWRPPIKIVLLADNSIFRYKPSVDYPHSFPSNVTIQFEGVVQSKKLIVFVKRSHQSDSLN